MIYFPCYYLGAKVLLLDDTLVHKHLFQRLNTPLYLLFSMRGHQCKTNQCVLWRTGWRYHRVDEHTVIKSQLGHHKGLINISHIQRNNRTLRFTNLKTFFLEAFQGVASDLPKMLYPLWFSLNDTQGFACGSCCGRRVRRTEYIGATGMAQIADGVAVRCDEAADRSQTL